MCGCLPNLKTLSTCVYSISHKLRRFRVSTIPGTLMVRS